MGKDMMEAGRPLQGGKLAASMESVPVGMKLKAYRRHVSGWKCWSPVMG
jgi:hypothetical protein